MPIIGERVKPIRKRYAGRKCLKTVNNDNNFCERLWKSFWTIPQKFWRMPWPLRIKTMRSRYGRPGTALKGSLLFLNPADAIKSAREIEEFASDGDLDAARRSLG